MRWLRRRPLDERHGPDHPCNPIFDLGCDDYERPGFEDFNVDAGASVVWSTDFEWDFTNLHGGFILCGCAIDENGFLENGCPAYSSGFGGGGSPWSDQFFWSPPPPGDYSQDTGYDRYSQDFGDDSDDEGKDFQVWMLGPILAVGAIAVVYGLYRDKKGCFAPGGALNSNVQVRMGASQQTPPPGGSVVSQPVSHTSVELNTSLAYLSATSSTTTHLPALPVTATPYQGGVEGEVLQATVVQATVVQATVVHPSATNLPNVRAASEQARPRRA